MSTAYQITEVMLPRGKVYHLQLAYVHPEVWPDLRRHLWSWRSDGPDNFPLLCTYASNRRGDDFIPRSGNRRLCVSCEWAAADLDGRVDELRWWKAVELGARDNDEVTRAFLAKVGW